MSATLYVDAATPGLVHNGSSWTTAYTDLQQALAVAVKGQTIEVGQGTYLPTTAADPTASFQLIDGVSVLGGFAGFGTQNPDARNVAAYPTILSGDIGSSGGNAYYSYHVVTGSGTDATAVLDGFIITGGNADGTNPGQSVGGGLYDLDGSPTLNNCTITGDGAVNGGGIYNYSSAPALTNCTIDGDGASGSGGGIYNILSSPVLTNCTIDTDTAGVGGGMFNDYSSPTLTNCDISTDSADTGGGICNNHGSPSLNNCTFNTDSAASGGGMANYSSNPIIVNCTFTGDMATIFGGGMFNDYSSPVLTGCTLTGAFSSDSGGGMFNESSNPALTGCTISGDGASNDGGGFYNVSSSPILTNCQITGNTAGDDGAGFYNENSSPTLIDSTVTGDAALNNGGGFFNYSSSPTLTNCTLNGDSALTAGGAMYNYSSSSPKVTNSILWADSAGVGNEIYNGDSISVPVVTYSDVDGGLAGTGNINADPQLISGSLLELPPTSPCVNAGSNAAIEATGITTDLAGNPRIAGGVVDMGAYEFQPVAETWTGKGEDLDWNDPLNWSLGRIPTSSDSVTIPAGFASIVIGAGSYSVKSLYSYSPIFLSGGSFTVYSLSVLNDASLTIEDGGRLNLIDSSFVIDYAPGNDPIATIRNYLTSGYNGGAWNGAGIISTSVAADNASGHGLVYAVGYADGADGIVYGLASGQIQITPTLAGDTQLTGSVGFGDYQIIARYYGSAASWDEGNFTYQNTINFGDFQILSTNIGHASDLNGSGLIGTGSTGELIVATPPAVNVYAPSQNPFSNGDTLAYDADQLVSSFGNATMLG